MNLDCRQTSEVMMLDGAEPRKILQTIIEKKVPAIMSYLSRDKWYVVKVLATALGTNRFDVEVSPGKKPHPINIHVDQLVGVSVKYGYGKFIFESSVVSLEPPASAGASSVTPAQAGTTSGGRIILTVPEQIEMVQRRSYFRIEVPTTLDVNVSLWHRCVADDKHWVSPPPLRQGRGWQGKLADISAGGAQIVVDAAQRPDFKKGQFIRLRFTPMPYEAPLEFGAHVRSILPTADDKNICFGLQTVGLEGSAQGRLVLQRLCNIAERYHQINQSNARQQDFQRISC